MSKLSGTSRALRDKAGNRTGVTLTFKDNQTCQERMQEIHSPKRLLQDGDGMLAPEKQFGLMMSQQSAASAAEQQTVK